ncbi:type II toxin-antitoxin system VapC family toxin [Synechocystis sp. CACIAM 05]|uniref:type II toxin-antitoxin system VapC family toxin n=1 Tax=Synechocystis sp. CACIAM 05 TaxID=1933929 RepID=UPI00138E7F8B|nr:type II toxin-antitoxin system VapC family toxin [Synechocystis sp. CACIAM 05]QHV00745.1 PIN domain-containing protein [Synechocystis sp. CACIAM 05]
MLLDTHTLLWFLDNDIKLPLHLKSLIEAKPKVYVSIVSLWEIAIKLNINKLRLNYAFTDLENLLADLNILVLNITWQHLEACRNLPLHHRDPFDRMIIAQAQQHNFSVISKDENFKKYNVNLIWE